VTLNIKSEYSILTLQNIMTEENNDKGENMKNY